MQILMINKIGGTVATVLFCLILQTGFLSEPLHAQIDTTDTDMVEDYNWRIMQRMLNGIYIPQDLNDAFYELERNASDQAISRFRNAPGDDLSNKLFFGLGRWMKSNWQFYEGSRFSHYLRGLGLSHPDDMVTFVIESFHLHLNEEDLRIEERVEELRERRFLISRRMMQRDTISVDTIR